MNTRQIWILSGAAAMALGTFLPILSLPFIGNQNYFQNGQGDGIFVLVLAVIIAILAFTKAIRFAWIPAAIASLVMLFTFVNLISMISEAEEELQAELEGNPFAGLAEGLFGSVQLQWGWIVMLGGVGAAIFGSLGKFSEKGPAESDSEDQ